MRVLANYNHWLCIPQCISAIIFARPADFFFNGAHYANNSVILLDDLGEEDEALHCRTTRPNCCKTAGVGDWYYPNGQLVPTKNVGDNFYRNRDDEGNVKLNRINNAQSPKGRYKCGIVDDRGILVYLNLVIYSAEGK